MIEPLNLSDFLGTNIDSILGGDNNPSTNNGKITVDISPSNWRSDNNSFSLTISYDASQVTFKSVGLSGSGSSSVSISTSEIGNVGQATANFSSAGGSGFVLYFTAKTTTTNFTPTVTNFSLNGTAQPLIIGNISGEFLSEKSPILEQSFIGTFGIDVFTSNSGNDLFDGLSGIDTVIYSDERQSHEVSKADSSWTVISTANGTDTLTNIERLHFSDTKLALDLDGNAGITAKILGAVFGASSVTNKEYVGIGLSFLDSGTSYEDLMHFALTAAGATTHAAVVNLLWTNLFNSAPTTEEASPYISMLDDGSMSIGALGVLAADLPLNASNINLVGLQQTGIEYLM